MIIEKIGTGNSIAEAYENAKVLLAAPEDAELHQEIIQDVKKKLFGLKTEPAKVRVWYEIPDAPVREEKPAKPVQKTKKPVEQKPGPKAHSEKTSIKETPKNAAPKANAVKEEVLKAVKADTAKDEASKTKVVPNMIKEEINENDSAANYLKMIIEGIGITDYSLSLAKAEDSNEYVYTIECEEDGTLIGRRGETLDSIQYLLRLSINKGIDDDKHRKISVNIGNYREKRIDNLRALAHRSAKQVLKYGRNVVLDPMNPYERRIIHTAIQEIDGVTSHSTGVDAGRKVVISLEEGVQPTHPSKGGYNNRGPRRDNRRGGGKGSYQKKEAYQPEKTREPRKDAAGSLYGKIEIPKKTVEE
ncbi:MAG: Jag N-terminal domain-containing protein [Clostridia bacterium]|nr:Jag N-terminal domain-containing protein [Clostridia bacterium]